MARVFAIDRTRVLPSRSSRSAEPACSYPRSNQTLQVPHPFHFSNWEDLEPNGGRRGYTLRSSLTVVGLPDGCGVLFDETRGAWLVRSRPWRSCHVRVGVHGFVVLG